MITGYLHRNPRIVWLLLATIVIAGLSSYFVIPRLEDPVLGQRVAVVTTTYPGADPAKLDSTVSNPIESWLKEFPEIKQVRSNTRTNISNVVIELHDQVNDAESVWSSIENKLSANAGQLPAGCNDPDLDVFPLKAFAAILAIVPKSEIELDPFQHRRLARELRARLLNLSSTESVEIFGDPGEQISIEVDPAVLSSTGLTVGRIAQQIEDSELVPAGDSELAGMQLIIDIQEEADLIQRLGQVFITYRPDEEPTRLSEIATIVRRTRQPQTSQALVDGRKSLVLGIMASSDSRIDLWTQQLQQVTSQFKQDFPGSFSVEPLFLQSSQIDQRMNGLLQNLAISTLAVVLLVFLLMGWRCMIVVAISLPLSALLVLCGLRMLSIPIHQMSVTGLIVALGLLIDNAIVMVEEVRSRIFKGLKPLQAMTEAIRHLGMPLFGSTLTTILAFLPIATLPGPAGEFVGSIAVSVILAIGASFLLAITLLPQMMIMLGVNENRTGLLDYGIRFKPLESLYRLSLKATFKVPLLGILLGAALPVIGFYFAQGLPRQFFPATDRNQLQIELEMPASSRLGSVRESVDIVNEIVAADAQVRRQCWFLGHSAPTFYYNVVPRRRGTPSYAQAFVDFSGQADADQLANRLQKQIDAQVLGARVIVRKLEQGPPFDAPLEIRVLGNDIQMLEKLGTELRQILSTTNSVTHTRADLEDTVRKMDLDLDPAASRDAKLSPQDVSKFLFAAVNGAPAGTLFDSGQELPIHVRVDYGERSKMELLSALQVSTGRPVSHSANQSASGSPPTEPPPSPTLGSLGEFGLNAEVAAVLRLDGRLVNEVKAYTKSGVLPSVVLDEFKSRLGESDFVLPDGYRIEYGGESEKRDEAVSTLIANAVVLFALMLLTLVAVLGSFRGALTIAAVGGLAIGLGPLALYCFGFPFGFMAIVGTMGLVGVAINDSIVVLAAIRANRKEAAENGAAARELSEVVFGCTRHIIATTLTTMIGFLPLILDGGRFWPPLAIVISAGVGGATLLALYFVPSLYLVLFGNSRSATGDNT